MRIRVDEIPESGRILRFRWDRLGEFVPPEDPFELKLDRPVDVRLEINRRTDHIRIQGTIQGAIQVACHRCLKAFQRPLDEKVDVYLVEERAVPEEEEAELEVEEMDFEFFDGEVIEIDRLVAEQIFLTLPFKILCSDECRGLCPRCGANLNVERCGCALDLKGSAFAGLQTLKSRLPEE